MKVASLPMYDLPEVAAATDALWQGLAAAFRREGIDDVPDRLTRAVPLTAHWLAPALLFSQTCGYPLTHDLAGRVTLLATPCYAAPGCAGADYRSMILVGADSNVASLADLRGRVAAVNGWDSQSGYSALRAVTAPWQDGARFFGAVALSGSHLASVAMVTRGEADVAAIDCVTLALARRFRPAALAGIRVLCDGPPAPGLPYVTAGRADDDLVERLRAGAARAFADPSLADARDALLLTGFEVLPLSAYRRIADIENEAISRGYPQLA